MSVPLSPAPTTVRIDPTQVMSESIEDETIIIDSITGAYFTLDGVGSTVWSLLGDEPRPVVDVVASVAAAVGHAAVEIAPVVNQCLADLQSYGVLRTDGPGLAPVDPAALGASPVPRVLITRYSDLEELILLDPIHEVDPSKGWPQPRRD